MRGVALTYETVREWCLKFGQTYAKMVQVNRPGAAFSLGLRNHFLTLPRGETSV